jgi:hypothetical protein
MKKRQLSFAHHTKRTISHDSFLAFVVNLEPLLSNIEIVLNREIATPADLLHEVNRNLQNIITLSDLAELVYYDEEIREGLQYFNEETITTFPESITSVNVWINTDKVFDQTAQSFVSAQSSSSSKSVYTSQLLAFAQQYCPCQVSNEGLIVSALHQVMIPLTAETVKASIASALLSNSRKDMSFVSSLPLDKLSVNDVVMKEVMNLSIQYGISDDVIFSFIDAFLKLFQSYVRGRNISGQSRRNRTLSTTESVIIPFMIRWFNAWASKPNPSRLAIALIMAVPDVEINNDPITSFATMFRAAGFGVGELKKKFSNQPIVTSFEEAQLIKQVMDKIVHPDLYTGNFYVKWLTDLPNPAEMYLEWARSNAFHKNNHSFHDAYSRGELRQIPPGLMWSTLPAGDETDELLDILDRLPKTGIDDASPIDGETALQHAYHQRLPRLVAKLIQLGAQVNTVRDEICENGDKQFVQFVDKCSTSSLHRAYAARNVSQFVDILSQDKNSLNKKNREGKTVIDLICDNRDATFWAYVKWYVPDAFCRGIGRVEPVSQGGLFSGKPYQLDRSISAHYTVQRPQSRSVPQSFLSRAASFIGLADPPKRGGFYFGGDVLLSRLSGPVSVYLLRSTVHPDLPVVMLMGDYHKSYWNMCGSSCASDTGCVDLRRPDFFHALDKLDYADKISVFTEFYDWDPQGTTERDPEKWTVEEGFHGGVIADFLEYATPCMRPVHRRKPHPKPCQFNHIKWHMGDARFGGLKDRPSIEMAEFLLIPTYSHNANYVRQYARENPHYRKVLLKIFGSLYDISKRSFSQQRFVDTFVDEILKEENAGMSLIAKQLQKQTIPVTAAKLKEMLTLSIDFRFKDREHFISFDEDSFVSFIDSNGLTDWESILFKQTHVPAFDYWRSLFVPILDLYVLLRMVKSTHDSRLAIGYFGDAHTTNLDMLLRQYYGYETVYAQNANLMLGIGMLPSRCIDIVENVNVEEMVKRVTVPQPPTTTSNFGKKTSKRSSTLSRRKGPKHGKSCKKTIRKSRK